MINLMIQIKDMECHMLTPECAVIHEHDLVQKLLVAEAPTGQTGMYYRSYWYATSAAWISNLLLGRDPIREEASWFDLASAGQLDPPPNVIETKGDKKLGFEKEELGFGDKK
jgi:hypothetical protein